MANHVLYVVVCGAGPAGQVGTLVAEAQARGWDIWVITTPAGLAWIRGPTRLVMSESACRCSESASWAAMIWFD
jgi:hypothetical protein